jgi:hypothetical protein
MCINMHMLRYIYIYIYIYIYVYMYYVYIYIYRLSNIKRKIDDSLNKKPTSAVEDYESKVCSYTNICIYICTCTYLFVDTQCN